MLKKIIFFLFALAVLQQSFGQELRAKVTVAAQQLGTQVNQNIFKTLEQQLGNLINNRAWTKDVFQQQERIQCTFFINIREAVDDNVYKGTLTVQAARPVFNSDYQSPIINFQDQDFTFKYIEYQPVEFNESRVAGSDALAANLTATIAYYVYIILGLDYDSFGLKEGATYFEQAQNIVTNAPDGRDIGGWKPFDGTRNRYWLATNLNNPKLNIIHDIFYNYYRTGLDMMYEDERTARDNMIKVLNQLKDFSQENPNTMVMQFFMQGKSEEWVGVFKKADPVKKSTATEVLVKIDAANASKYRQELK